MFVLQNTPPGEGRFHELEVSSVEIETGISKFDLLLEITESPDGLRTGIQYNTDLFSAETVTRMLQQFETLLNGIVADPQQAISALPLMDAAEQQQLLHQFNATAVAVADTPVHRLVEAQVQRSPDAVAVRDDTQRLSYAELNARANRLAHHLANTGIGPGQRVALCTPRGVDTAVAVLAVLKAGAAYVPVDPNFPADRVAYMLADSAAALILTRTELRDQLPDGVNALCLDSFDFDTGAADNLPDTAAAADTLYAIYTSGSTGQPKASLLTHAGLGNLLQWQATRPGLGEAARSLQFASMSFDVSFQELFSTWTTGGELVIVAEDLRRDLPALARFIATEAIQRLYLPYAALQPLADTAAHDEHLEFALNDVIVAGEQLQITPSLRAWFKRLNGARLHNQYGPSETHVVTAYTLGDDVEAWPALPPIGTPVANTRVYVLDPHLQPVPLGVPGELYLGGVQLATGYLNRPELTAARFIADPFSDGGRLYRTGDRVRLHADGNLDYLGRTDDQLKWRGFRIEPGEIEAVLTDLPNVAQAAVLLREDHPGDPRLVAYLVAAPTAPDIDAVRAALKQRLPDYMVPAAFVILDALPLTPSGKVARRLLPAPDWAADAHAYVAPRNPVEEVLVQLFADVLGLEQVGVHDDFFHLGGHSLLATQLISRIRDAFQLRLPLKYVFRYPSPAELGETVATLKSAAEIRSGPEAGEREEIRL